MTEPINVCLFDFLTRFFRDIDPISPERGFVIGARVYSSVGSYIIENQPSDGLSSILDDFKNCIEPSVGSAAITTSIKIAEAIFYFVILTAIFMILVVIILGSLDKKRQSGIIIGIILFFALLYIIVGSLLIHNSFLTILNEITIVEQVTDKCVQNIISDTELLVINQETVINDALCNYPLPLPTDL